MIKVEISSFNVAVAIDNILHNIDKPKLGQIEITFCNFEELRAFTEDVLKRMGITVLEDGE